MSNNNVVTKSRVPEMPSSERGGFCGALQRAPPPMPAGLARRLANKDNFGLGKVSFEKKIIIIILFPKHKKKINKNQIFNTSGSVGINGQAYFVLSLPNLYIIEIEIIDLYPAYPFINIEPNLLYDWMVYTKY